MKPFIEVVLIAAAILLFAFGFIPASIFVGMFAVIVFIAPESKPSKTPEQLMAEARGETGDDVLYVSFSFVAEPSEVFDVVLHSTDLTEENVMNKLVEYLVEHTGIPTTADRLHLLTLKQG